MRKFIKLMVLRFELAHANRMITHLATQLLQNTLKEQSDVDQFEETFDCMIAWRKQADCLSEQIKALTSPPCPIDESETLSPRCPSPLFWVK